MLGLKKTSQLAIPSKLVCLLINVCVRVRAVVIQTIPSPTPPTPTLILFFLPILLAVQDRCL